MSRGLREPFGKQREFWALRDVSFDVERGTILGIIGPNGAGKSTLLKILARISPPTVGDVRGRWRVVSLLELGAGFNPEVSARENIIMNAAMYGVPRSEVDSHFDDIIAFAEIEQFLDTPLKFYSSGMYLRLAFSVAINMNPQTLLADEILAVGDLAFQERCLQRITEMATEGLTVLFVLHDLEALSRVCNQVLWLSAGRIERHGDPAEVVEAYRSVAWAKVAAKGEKGKNANKYAMLLGAKLVSAAGQDIGAAPIVEEVRIRLRFSILRAPVKVRMGFDLTHRGGLIFRTMSPEWIEIAEPGFFEGWATVPAGLFAEIMYGVNAFLLTDVDGKEASVIIYNAVTFMGYDSASIDQQALQKGGLLAPRLSWTLSQQAEPIDA